MAEEEIDQEDFDKEEEVVTSDGKRLRRPSYITRLFGHFMDVNGAEHGTWNVGMLYLERAPTHDELVTLIKTKLLRMKRFKSVLKVHKHGANWEELDDIDWQYHLGIAFEEETIDEDQLREFVGNMFERGLDEKKPLWRFTLIPNLDLSGDKSQDSGAKAALIACINHAIGDGVSTIGVLLNILDDSPIDPTKPLKKQLTLAKSKTKASMVTADSKNENRASKDDADLDLEMKNDIVHDDDEAGKVEIVKDEDFVVVKRNKKPAVGMGTRVSMFLYGVKEGLYGPFGRHDPPSSLKLKKDKDFVKNFSGKKLLAKTETLRLDEIKKIKNRFGSATVNDVLLALLTMTIKGFLEEIDDPVLKYKNPLRGNFPVSTRGTDEPILKDGNPSNSWQPLAFRFPFDYKSAIDCVWKVKDQVDKHKVSPQLIVQNANAKMLNKILPRVVMMDVGLRLNDKVTAMLSNVPGPQKEVHVCNGIAIKEICFYVFSPLGLYLGLLSYANKVSLSVNMDIDLNQDPKQLVKHWMVAYNKLKEEINEFGPEATIPKSAKARKKFLEKRSKEQVKVV